MPVYPCGICRKEVNDDDEAILCESGCESWFHRVCTGMSKKAYDLLTAELSAEWVGVFVSNECSDDVILLSIGSGLGL